MKKILVLMLVLGLISVANAGTLSGELKVGGNPIGNSIDIVKGDTLTLQVYSATGGASSAACWSGFIEIKWGDDGALSNPWKDTTKVGDLGLIAVYDEVDWGHGYQLAVDYISTAPVAGIQFTVDIDTTSLNIGNSGRVGIFDDMVGYVWSQDEVDYTVFHVVPEPMTLVLLGLGGLFLRRRR